jgi:hypothetical protein
MTGACQAYSSGTIRIRYWSQWDDLQYNFRKARIACWIQAVGINVTVHLP